MTTDNRIPPPRDLPEVRLVQRREHLLAEIAPIERRRALRGRPRAGGRLGRGLTARASALALALIVCALLLASPWEGSPSLAERALAAIGNEPVLHVVTSYEGPQGGRLVGQIIEIDTGEVVPARRETEIWFDESRALKKAVERYNGRVLDEVLETPQGGFTQGGPLITCAWIAAHPVEATKRRVSCNENMENGTTPRQIPETPPTLDPRLGEFIDHYRAALASGQAEEIARDTIDGRNVIWLRFATPRSPPPSTPEPLAFPAQEVAVDASSYRPVRLRNADGSWAADVTVAETLSYSANLFRRPLEAPPGPSVGRNKEIRAIELSQGASLLGRSPLWLGEEWRGFRLVEVTELELVTGYGRLSGLDPTFAPGIRLTYAMNTENWREGATIDISEAATCNFALFWPCGQPLPGEGQLQRHGFPSTALARTGGLYVTIQSRGAPPPRAERGRSWEIPPGIDQLTIARALRPAP
jgi:hypothetical protein